MSDPPVTWQVKVTPYDRGNMGVVKERLDAAGFSSVRRRRSLLLGVSTKEQGEEVADAARRAEGREGQRRVEDAARMVPRRR
jgi:hypothetical protein